MQYNYKKLGGKKVAFQIKPDKRETENKTIRFPVSLINEIEKVLIGQNTSFSGFVIQACEYALDNMEISSPEKLPENSENKP